MSATSDVRAGTTWSAPSWLRQAVRWAPLAFGSAIVIVLLVRAWTSTVAAVVATVLLLTASARLVARDVKTRKQAGCVALALGAAAAPIVGATLAGGTLSSWTRIYVAGAVGGLVFELLIGRGQIELPGLAGRADDSADDPRRPLLTQVDLRVFARLVLGGVAAFVVVMIAAASGGNERAEAIERAARSDISIAWAIAIGSSSTAVWRAIERIVQARLDAVAGALSSSYAVLEKVKKDAIAHHEVLAAFVTSQPSTDAAVRIGEIVGAISTAQEHLRVVAARRGVAIDGAGESARQAARQ